MWEGPKQAGRGGEGERVGRLGRPWERQVSVWTRARARLAAHDARSWVALDIQHGQARHMRAPPWQSEVQPRSQREFCARKPKRIGQEGLARAAQTLASTFLASTTHGVEVALFEHPA